MKTFETVGIILNTITLKQWKKKKKQKKESTWNNINHLYSKVIFSLIDLSVNFIRRVERACITEGVL